MRTRAFRVFALIVLSLGWWQAAGLWLRSLGPDWLVALPIVAWILASVLALSAIGLRQSGWIYAQLVTLVVVPWVPSLVTLILPGSMSLGFSIQMLMTAASVLLTLFLYSGRGFAVGPRTRASEDGDSDAARRQADRVALLPVLSALTLVWWQFGLTTFGFRLLGVPSWLSGSLSWLMALMITLLLVWALAQVTRRGSQGVWILAALLFLVALSLPASVVNSVLTASPEPPFGLVILPSTALLVAALLLVLGLSAYRESRQGNVVAQGDGATGRTRTGSGVITLALGGILVAKTLHHLYWFTIWDNTYDSLGYLLLLVPLIGVLLSGIVLSIALSGRMKLAGFVYPLLVFGLMVGISARAQDVDFHRLTQARAERVRQAVEAYRAREGRYPQDLRQLIPRYSLWLPGPVIIYGQDWCYDGGDEYYRLGYVYRKHWSDPRLIGRSHRTKGDVPDLPGVCEQAVAALQERYPDYPYEYSTDGQ